MPLLQTELEPLTAASAYPTLDPLQVGQMRRILNLASLLPDDWSGMMGRSSLQEDFGALRFQLAYMSYALALTHVHRLPAAPGLIRAPFERLIEKMLSPDVWTYWHYVSTANGAMNNFKGEQPAEWDPVVKDNIMYSAYLQSMALLYHYLFRDDRYARAGALTLSYRPLFWGDGQKQFVYDENSLNDHIYWNMVENGFLGIACEPNCVFQICNQVPILGFRLHDLIHGGATAKEVTEGYLRAWAEFGLLNANGHFTMMVQEHERNAFTPEAPWSDFWLGTLMHAWNPALVEANYPRQIARWGQDGPGGTMMVPLPAEAMRDPLRASARDFGWAAACAAEMGDDASLQGMLDYADRFLAPRWEQGGYFYPREDRLHDAAGHPICMDPHTGNALLALARLNVPGGFAKLYAGPLDDDHFADPALVGVPEDIDVSRAWYDRGAKRLLLRIAPCRAGSSAAELTIANIWERGAWTLMIEAEEVASGSERDVERVSGGHAVRRGDALKFELELTSPTDIELRWRQD